MPCRDRCQRLLLPIEVRMLARLCLEGRVLTGSRNAPHTGDLRESSGFAMLTWHEVESTSIRAIGYDPDRCEVSVEHINRSGPYVYFDVPAEVYAGLEQADRKGPYVNLVIKQYRYEYRGRWPDDGARSDSHEGRVGGFRVPG
jgi:hypothetical protein